MIGLFGIGEIFCMVEEGLVFCGECVCIMLMVILCIWVRLLCYWLIWLCSVLVGCWMGVILGGFIVVLFMSYSLVWCFLKNCENFGKGEVEGVIVLEIVDYSVGISVLLLMLMFGIFGLVIVVVMFGGLMIWGLYFGLMLFVE